MASAGESYDVVILSNSEAMVIASVIYCFSGTSLINHAQGGIICLKMTFSFTNTLLLGATLFTHEMNMEKWYIEKKNVQTWGLGKNTIMKY